MSRQQCVFKCDQFDILHYFPKPEYPIAETYLKDKTDREIYNNHRICNRHFEDHFLYPRTKRLAKTAYPSLNLGLHAETGLETTSHIPDVLSTQISGTSTCVNRIRGTLIKRSTKMKKILHKIQILKKKKKCQKNQIKAADKMSKTKLFQKVLKTLSKPAQTLLNMQLSQHNKRGRGRRFNIEEKLLALSIYKRSPKGYNFLRKLFTLPSKRTLQDVLKKITLKTGLNPIIFRQIKDAAQKFNTEERLCLLMFDEMSLSPSLQYDKALDQIVGFEDFGENDQNDNIADHVLVFMLKGVKIQYKQPICFAFCKSATNATVLKKLIKSVIKEIFQAGLIVVATVCDQSTINTKVVNELLKETNAEYLRLGKEHKSNAFQIENHDIFPLFDPPHLLKGVRNNLISKDLRYVQNDQVKIAKWQQLKLLLEIDAGEDELRMCNKLTEMHVMPEKIPKMKVKHAAEVFSQRVSGALRFCAKNKLLPQECLDTADILLLFDQLFDSFNGGSYKKTYKIYKNCVKPNSDHFTLWNKVLPVLRSMRFKTEIKKRSSATSSVSYEQVPSIKNWIHNIDTIKGLLQYLFDKYNLKSILMRNFNQDPLENFFSSVRSHGARNNNPTCLQFQSIYKTLLVNNLSSTHSLGANCEEDFNKVLNNLDCLLAKNDLHLPPKENRINIDFIVQNLAGNDTQEFANKIVTETKRYVAGQVIKKSKIKVWKSCFTCNNELCDTTPPQVDDYILSVDVTRRSLMRPSKNFLECVENVIKIIKNVLQNGPYSGICDRIKLLIDLGVEFEFLSCNKHKENLKTFIINYIISLIIHSWCMNVMKILQGRHVKIDENDKIKIQAKKYYLTHRYRSK